MENLLTLKEIAGQIGVPESNLRYYRNRIGEFLPSAGRGRKRRYFPEAIEVFQKTVSWLQDGMTLDRVYGLLATEDARNERPPAQAPLSIERIADTLREALAASLPPPAPPLPFDEIVEAIGRIEAKIAEWRNGAVAQAEQTAGTTRELERQIAGLQREIAVLQENQRQKDDAAAALRQEGECLRETLQDKEHIIEEQRTRLLEIRALRNLFLEEVRQIRASVQQPLAMRRGSQPNAG